MAKQQGNRFLNKHYHINVYAWVQEFIGFIKQEVKEGNLTGGDEEKKKYHFNFGN